MKNRICSTTNGSRLFTIDRNKMFRGTTAVEDRSLMNICFVMNEEYAELEKPFMEFATSRGMVGIKGHMWILLSLKERRSFNFALRLIHHMKIEQILGCVK